MICVSIGFGFFVEFTLDEAKAFIEKRVPVLEASAAELTEKAAKIKARIKVCVSTSHPPPPPTDHHNHHLHLQ
jgi:prefoldin subunit 5